MSSHDPEILRRAFESRLGDVYTAMVGRIETYYPATQTADIVPVVKRPVPTSSGNVAYEDLPIVPNVPICFPRGGQFFITWTLSKGDHVLLIVLNYSISQWRKNGTISEPGDLRMHHLGNALALPTLAPNSGAVPEAQAGDNAYIISGPMIKLGSADASDFAALSSKVDSNFEKISSLFSAWVPVPNDGGAALKTASESLSFDPVACTKVKIS